MLDGLKSALGQQGGKSALSLPGFGSSSELSKISSLSAFNTGTEASLPSTPSSSSSSLPFLSSFYPSFLRLPASASSSPSSATLAPGCGSLSYPQRMASFAMFAIAGLFMFFMSSYYVMMIVLGKPIKFAVTYTLGNLFLLASSGFLVGFKAQRENMFAPVRATASIVYLSTLFLTLFAVWQMPYLYVVLPVVSLQVASLLWYIASYIPFGRKGLEMISRVVTGLVKRFLTSICKRSSSSILPM